MGRQVDGWCQKVEGGRVSWWGGANKASSGKREKEGGVGCQL